MFIKVWKRTFGISYNVRDIRSFSGTKWKKNLGEGRAELRTVYPLLYAPTTERRRAQRGANDSEQVHFALPLLLPHKYRSFRFLRILI